MCNFIKLDFIHRNISRSDVKNGNLCDTLEPSLKRAAAIADLMEVAGLVDDGAALDLETIRYAMQAIRMEMKDASVILEAMHYSNKTLADDDKRREAAADSGTDELDNTIQAADDQA